MVQGGYITHILSLFRGPYESEVRRVAAIAYSTLFIPGFRLTMGSAVTPNGPSRPRTRGLALFRAGSELQHEILAGRNVMRRYCTVTYFEPGISVEEAVLLPISSATCAWGT